jgi:hypothetical protein
LQHEVPNKLHQQERPSIEIEQAANSRESEAKMKRFTVVILGLTVVLSFLAALLAAHRTRAQETSIQPFTAVEVRERIESPDDGSAAPVAPYYNYKTVAVRADGSMAVLARWKYSAAELYTRDVFDATAKRNITVDDVTRSLVEDQFNELTNVLHAGQTCEGSPAGKIEGFDVLYKETTYAKTGVGPNVSTIMKEWNAPKLGCYSIRYEGLHMHGTNDVSHSTVQLTNFRLGDPDPRYFEIPTNYAARTPEVWRVLFSAAIAKGRQALSQ